MGDGCRKKDLRNSVRQPFVANAIVNGVDVEKQIVGLIRDLSLSGCYVETTIPLSPGTNIGLIIAHNGKKFRAFGRVVHVAENKGMGIAFTSVLPDDQTILERWVKELGL